jgi:predicted DCC family thiol-disulfide oxidoreductase YuxK
VDERRVSIPPSTPVLVFDGDCGFCRFWVERWRQRTGPRVEYLPFQSADVARRFPDIPREQAARAVQFVDSHGHRSEAADAVFRLFAAAGLAWPLRAYHRIPGVRPLTERAYRLVADHRGLAARITTLLWGRASHPSTYALARWFFFRLLALVYLAAFASLATQIVGLVGRDGILPAGVSDGSLQAVCIGGVVLASLLLAGLAPLVLLPLLWGGYLWISSVSGPFLSFQWDALLLETGALAVLIAPAALRDSLKRAADPPRLGVWLMLWLLFRLMLRSGVVKLASGDATWHGLTALSVHYETQPLPTPPAWYLHQLPAWFHRAATAGVLAIELGAPWLLLGPRRVRTLAFVLFAGLQVAIAVTGNYAFFNLLSIALCLFLLDDATLSSRTTCSPAPVVSRVRHAATVAVAVVTVPVSALMFTSRAGVTLPGWQVVVPMAELVAPLRSVNGYGLFAVMTTTRREIVVEGSNDGQTWLPYEFRYKPGDLRRPPPWVAPHQPRLDWQMWFAALGRYDEEDWFQNLCMRLLEGSPAVLRLLERDPFGGRPPRFIRSTLYRYTFSTPGERQREGRWWNRELLAPYSPVFALPASRVSRRGL